MASSSVRFPNVSTPCTFIVRKVYGAAMIGDIHFSQAEKGPIIQHYNITLEEIVKHVNDNVSNQKFPKIHDLTDYFLEGDRFGGIWLRSAAKMIEIDINMASLRQRRGEAVSVLKDEISAIGYVVKENPYGELLIWAKMKDGSGSLVLCPPKAICSKEVKDELAKLLPQMNFPPVSVTMKKAPSNQTGPEYSVITNECISLHSAGEKAKDAYFPRFTVEGIMATFLGDSEGSILELRSCRSTTANKNRPEPFVGDKIYCPPWAFIIDSSRGPSRWQEYCRLGAIYTCSVVFVKENGPSFGCWWIAIGVKQIADFKGPPSNNSQQAMYLMAYQDYRAKKSKMTDWNPNEARKRIERQLVGLGDGDGGADNQLAKNCRALVEFSKNLQETGDRNEGPDRSISAPESKFAGVGARRRQTVASIACQTTVDQAMIEETKNLLAEIPKILNPSKLDEFVARFDSILHLID